MLQPHLCVRDKPAPEAVVANQLLTLLSRSSVGDRHPQQQQGALVTQHHVLQPQTPRVGVTENPDQVLLQVCKLTISMVRPYRCLLHT
jgi:hypothetical protein